MSEIDQLIFSKSKQKISVVIPTFNRKETLLRAIKSVLSQSYLVHEILICDDGSNDGSRDTVETLKSPLIKWVDCGRNGMPSIPRNIGIQLATGDWIAFLDSDDEWLPAKLELQVNLLVKGNAMAISSNAQRISNKQKKGPYLSFRKREICFSDLLHNNYIICSSVIVNRSLLQSVSMFPEGREFTAIEDYALWLRLCSKINFLYISQPLLNYYDDPVSSIRTFYDNAKSIQRVVFSNLTDWLKEHDVKLGIANSQHLAFAIDEVLNESSPSIFSKIKWRVKNILPFFFSIL